MNAIEDLFVEIEHHGTLMAHAKLIHAAKEQYRGLEKELEEYKSLSGVVACAYCGHISPKGDNLAILEHTMSCDLRPERKLLEKAFAIEDGLFSKLDHVATSGYHLEGCDICDSIRKALEVWHSEPQEESK